MKSSRILLSSLCGLSFLIVSGALAQTVSNASVAAKGVFKFDKNYPKSGDGKTPLNLLTGFLKPENGQKINYLVFRISDEMVRFQRSISMNTLYVDVKPCSGLVNPVLSHTPQPLGGFLEPITGRTDLLPYLKKASLFQLRNYWYVAIDSNLRSYAPGKYRWGYEWLPIAVQGKQICLTISVGRMGHGGFKSQPVNISKLSDFVFLDDK